MGTILWARAAPIAFILGLDTSLCDSYSVRPLLTCAFGGIMAKSLQQRIDDAFSADGSNPDQIRGDAIEYCKSLRETWADVSVSLNRTVVLMVATAGLFEFFRIGKAAKITYEGVEFSSLTVVQAFLPAVIAYFYLEVILLAFRYLDTQRLYSMAGRIAYPNIVHNNLDAWLAPPSRAMLSPGSASLLVGGESWDTSRFEDITVYFIVGLGLVFSLFLPLAFEGYAFWVLFRQGSNSAWVWGTLVVTLALLTASFMILYPRVRKGEFSP
jgi:hypothetical protein